MSSNTNKPSSSTSFSELIILKTFDDVTFSVERSVIMKSITIKSLLDDGCGDVVIEYLTKRVKLTDEDSETKTYEENFAEGFNYQKMFDLISVANYLEIKELIDLISQKIADRTKDMQQEEIRKIFNIKNDFTEEEEAAIRKEYAWAFEI
ncbi:hypothetical protein ACJIZ3_017662 [Penstemon smallii]|uniref:SKP1-like protein n=1 Tax=Penstemon smallii TaxID=265156 RepID=A0ABD3SW65_9LAMI